MSTSLAVQAVAEGPRATDRFSAVTAAFVSGLSARTEAPELGANFTAQLAGKLEAAYTSNDTLSSTNLANLFAQLYVCDLLPASCVYSCLEQWRARFTEPDVALVHVLLKACGAKLRVDDPTAMKVCHSHCFCQASPSLCPCSLHQQMTGASNEGCTENLSRHTYFK